jgi:hypothetical protein
MELEHANVPEHQHVSAVKRPSLRDVSSIHVDPQYQTISLSALLRSLHAYYSDESLFMQIRNRRNGDFCLIEILEGVAVAEQMKRD